MPDKSLRILTVVSSLGPGGTERAAENYTLGYAASGVPVAVLAGAGGSRADTLTRAGIPVFLTGPDRKGYDAALRAALDWNPNIVHIHRHRASPESTAILKQLQTPQRRVLETNVFSRFDASPSGTMIDVSLQLSRWCLWRWQHWRSGSPGDTVGTVIPYSVDSRAFFPSSEKERAEMREQVGIPANAFVFGRVGQPYDGKWSLATLRAFAKIAPRAPDAFLLLAEAPPSFAKPIAALPDAIRRRILCRPFITGDENLRRFYGVMDVFLHTATIGESFGYVLCEAMLCGIPIITLSRPSRDNSQPEVVGHMQGGLVAARETFLPQAMLQLIEQPALRRQLSCSAPEWVRSRFDLPLVARNLIRVAEIALACNNRRQIAERLQAEGFITQCNDEEIHTQLRDAIGTPSPLELFLMRVEHVPQIYRTYTRLNALRARLGL